MLNKDYQGILQILLNNKVQLLIVGAYAMAVYSYPRATRDLDIWVESSLENSKKVYKQARVIGTIKDFCLTQALWRKP